MVHYSPRNRFLTKPLKVCYGILLWLPPSFSAALPPSPSTYPATNAPLDRASFPTSPLPPVPLPNPAPICSKKSHDPPSAVETITRPSSIEQWSSFWSEALSPNTNSPPPPPNVPTISSSRVTHVAWRSCRRALKAWSVCSCLKFSSTLNILRCLPCPSSHCLVLLMPPKAWIMHPAP